MTDLGDTQKPEDLIPGNPHSLYEAEGALLRYASLLWEAGKGLSKVNTSDGWSGDAADAFRAAFDGQPTEWIKAGDAFREAASALDRYISTLEWAQGQASQAIREWNAGEDYHETAQHTLSSARSQLESAGSVAARAIGKARDQAPPKPGFLSRVGDFFSGVGHFAADVGTTVLEDVASFGNAALNHPGEAAAAGGGMLLAAAGGLGDGAGTLLSATGVGSIVGVPLDVVSTSAVVTGSATAAAGIGALAVDAAGPDHVMLRNGNDHSGGGSKGSGGNGEPAAPKTKQEFGDQAKNLGYGQRIAPQKAPFNSHGQPVYSNGKEYITPDVDGHNVSDGWKVFNRRGKRIGTYSWNLTRIKD
ncbi:putative T7SS-secreted protein [Streptomyces sp. NPDC059740]|uniref:putative T7SS-secreted protein n=1 Tax=Streptomyces sp. NPDC059740 TaxID=3346926 RepID=UPI0036566F10